jgi:glycosyltransferase involved in cell wall biosynthesis
MTKSYKMSIVIPCFNHGEFLAEAVASVTDIERDDVELIVVDDGSTDERTRRELDDLVAQGIRVVRQENKGLAAARNAGILASQGEYIFPLDADDRLRPGWLDRGILILDSDQKVGVVYGDAQCFGVRSDLWVVGPFESARLLHWNYIHASALYRRSVWEQNRGYDSRMSDGTLPFRGLEDWDFWLGALENGWQFAYVSEVFFDYRVASESMVTRTHGFEKQIEKFIATKHGHLYRHSWLELARQQESLKWAFRNFRRLFRAWFIAQIDVIRDTARGRFWHPVLNATRPVRHALGLRRKMAGHH